MRVYGLTKLGKRVCRTSTDSSVEMGILHYIRDNRTVTEDEVKVVGGEPWVLSRLMKQGLVKELTNSG